MDPFWEEIHTLVSKSGGGVNPLESLGAQGIRGIALFLSDGSVAVLPVGDAHAFSTDGGKAGGDR